MKKYHMSQDLWRMIYDHYNSKHSNEKFTSKKVDQMINRDYGLEVVRWDVYAYYVRDEHKFTLFLLRWSHENYNG